MSYRASRLLLAFFCHELLVAALYFQYVEGLNPCPLCIFQRIAVFAMGLVFLVAAVHHPGPKGRLVYDLSGFLVALLGATIAGRQVWLQHLPADQVPACGPGLDYMLDTLPLAQTIALVFRGSGDCAEVQWQFLGFSMPEWTLMIFCLIALYLLWQLRIHWLQRRFHVER
ncbi:MAG: disulfide bond formation protein B [Gammaproteobacteria bacterium]|nr:MAG: disulfide bond formation protein B [Gammaproteobacteria bacterium]